MTTRAELLTGLRLRLGDVEKRRWDDTELTAYLNDAARDYSKHFPRKREQQFVTDGTSQRYDLPSDTIDDQLLLVMLVDPINGRREEVPHWQIRRPTNTRYYEVIDEKLVFGWIPYQNLQMTVRYNALHLLPASGAISIPSEDEDLIYAYAMAAAWQRIGGNDAGLSRWTEGQKRDDSPIIPHYVRLWERYDNLIREKQSVPRFYQRVRVKGMWRT